MSALEELIKPKTETIDDHDEQMGDISDNIHIPKPSNKRQKANSEADESDTMEKVAIEKHGADVQRKMETIERGRVFLETFGSSNTIMPEARGILLQMKQAIWGLYELEFISQSRMNNLNKEIEQWEDRFNV